MNRRQAQDMLRHAAFLRTVPRKAFDFSVVATMKGDATPADAILQPGCGSVACAIGFMPVAFPRTFKWSDEEACGQREVVRRDGAWTLASSHMVRLSFRTAMDFYGIGHEEARLLFAPGHNPSLGMDSTPVQVAREMERFARKRLAQLDARAKAGSARAMAKGRKGAKA